MRSSRLNVALGMLAAGVAAGSAISADLVTRFSNVGGIANTRHNLTQRTTSPNISGAMVDYRNNYGEVCVYCHTPHGANPNLGAPLWNRTKLNTTYQTYDLLGTSTLTQTVSQPGANSLTCLSCHDGTIAIDSIINMPGSGQYNPAAATSHQESFLDSWRGGAGTTTSDTHSALGTTAPGGGDGCMVCHAAGGPGTDFAAFLIGTDLRNDHPVGVTFPLSGPGSADFKVPGGSGSVRYFDLDTDGRLSKNDIRLYDTGGGPEVECASCHDPHGVPSAGAGSVNNPSFLRVANTNSAVCLTCHNK